MMKKAPILILCAIALTTVCAGCAQSNGQGSSAPAEGSPTIGEATSAPVAGDALTTYELKTSEYFDGALGAGKYRIASADELEDFYALYSRVLEVDTGLFGQNDLFVEVRTESSGSVENTLDAVNLENGTVEFVIGTAETGEGAMGTMDMATWYFGAFIPKDQVEKMNVSEWQSPSDVKTA